MRPVLAFDLGGVLVENAGYAALRTLIGGTQSEQAIRKLWLESVAVTAYEAGSISSDVFARQLIDEMSLPVTPEVLLADFATWVRGFYPGAEALLRALRPGYTTACLSNSNALHWRPYFDTLFDVPLSSHRTGLPKPQLAAFTHLAEVVGRPMSDIWFFDDTVINVEAAAAAGMRAFHTEGFLALQQVLREILPESGERS